MYQVMIVDDEPTSLGHIRTILEKKCTGYEILATAENGAEAMEKIQKKQPDIVISDIKMPVMDGIELVSRIKKEYPEILSVIVSGYQDFDYAKSAIQSGVCDYLLKPLNPTDMQKLMQKLEVRLSNLYYEKRKQILRTLCNGRKLENESILQRYFPEGRYYSAIIRRNGLPKRFSRKTGVEIFSMEEEQFYIYGRDEMESLYLVPESLLSIESFSQVVTRFYERMQNDYLFVTAVTYEDSFALQEFPEIVQKIYRELDEAVIIGKNQMLKGSQQIYDAAQGENEKEKLACVGSLLKYKETGKILQEITGLFELWETQNRRQLYVEGQIQYLFQLIKNGYSQAGESNGIEFAIDDAFSYAASMQELKDSVADIIAQLLPSTQTNKTDDKQQLFHSLLSYLDSHLETNITLSFLCKKFAISQTSLSRLFREYKEMSFSNYLTMIRMERAKQLMDSNPDIYVKDVAESVGYSDQFYFSRIFHSVVGVCPSEYVGQGKG